VIWSLVPFALLLAPVLIAFWQLFQTDPFISPLTSGFILFFSGLFLGLRISANSAKRYMRDLQRKNHFLAELNRELAVRNHEYMIAMMDQDDEIPPVGGADDR